jgi:uncharacterized repeat protein (TIGR03803 family)
MTHAGVLSLVASLNSANASPVAPLVQGKDGNFYGSGTSGNGTLFNVTPTGTLSTLFTFNGGNGSSPTAGLMQGTDGNFYGTTEYGGAGGRGEVFQISPSGTFSNLFSFDINGTNGSSPDAELVQGADGNFYGTASSGGSFGGGNIFQIIIIRTAPVFLFASQTAGALTLTWSAVVGQTYQMQYCANLIQGGWSNFGGTIVATNATMLTIDPAPTDLQRFYRIVLQ